MKRLALPVVLLVGCASASRVPTGDAVRPLEQELARQEGLLTADARPDCPSARSLRDNICALAEKICALVARDPQIPEGPRRCQAARARCQAARARVRGGCGDT